MASRMAYLTRGVFEKHASLAKEFNNKDKVGSMLLSDYLRIGTLLALLVLAPVVHAQNVGGVFGPEVTPGSEAIEFRTAFAPPSDGRPDRITSRFHYQKSITDNLRLRGVVQGADTDIGGFDYDAVQLEAQYQFLEDEAAGFDSAIRVDLLIADDRPNLVSFNWTNDVPLSDHWSIRNNLLAQVQFGNDRGDGLFLQSRASVTYKVNKVYNFQIQTFSIYGSTDEFPAFRDQNHSIGPAVFIKFDKGWSVEASTLLGLTNASSDIDFRIFLARSF